MDEEKKLEQQMNPFVEFMLVYGWAILIVIFAIAALIYFEVIKVPW